MAYYGHPSDKDRTRRDLCRIQELIRFNETPTILMGDFNIQEEFLGIEDHLVMVDAAHHWFHHVEGGPPTYVAHDAATRLDRIFLGPTMAEAIEEYTVTDEVAVPQHRSVVLAIARRTQKCWSSTPLVAIDLEKVDDSFREQDVLKRTELDWMNMQRLPLDQLYRAWSAQWEAYLVEKYTQKKKPQLGRGKSALPTQEQRAPLRGRRSQRVARLSHYTKRLELVSTRTLPEKERSAIWKKLANQSRSMAKNYGIPDLPLDVTASTVHADVAKALHVHFKKALEAEIEQDRQLLAQRYRERLHKNNGVTRFTADILKGKSYRAPCIEAGGEIISSPNKILETAEVAWAEYYAQPQKIQDELWQLDYLSTIKWCDCPQPRVSPELLNGVVRAAKASTAAGPDGWHVHELQALPIQAWQQFALIIERAEGQGRIPVDLTHSWTALIPPEELPCAPLKLRPIAILPVLWRIWAKAYLQELQPWLQEAMPPTIHSYMKQRSAASAATRLAAKVENIQADPLAPPYYLAGLDASKAFPSASRQQVEVTLKWMGFPPRIWKLISSVYDQGQTRFRIMGRVASPSAHHLQRGLHQGCPLSVLSFNAVQVPLLERLATQHPNVEALAYADDLVLGSHDKNKLEEALAEVANYMDQAHIKLNPTKTRFWCSTGLEAPLGFAGEMIKPVNTIVILGMHIADTTVHPQCDHDTREIQRACKTLCRLPMTVHARQELYSSVIVSKLLYCPWRTQWSPKALTGARSMIISAMRPSLHKGARAQGLVMVHLLKGHRLDPLLSQLLALLRMITKMGQSAIRSIDVHKWSDRGSSQTLP